MQWRRPGRCGERRRTRSGATWRGHVQDAGRGLRQGGELAHQRQPLCAAHIERAALGLGPARLRHRRHDDDAGCAGGPQGDRHPDRHLDAHGRGRRAGRADAGERERRPRPCAARGRVPGADGVREGGEHGGDDGRCEPSAPGAGRRAQVRGGRSDADAGAGAAARRRRRRDRDRRRDRRAHRVCGPVVRPHGRGERADADRARGRRLRGMGRGRVGAAQPRRLGAGASRSRWRRSGGRRRAGSSGCGRRATRRVWRRAATSSRSAGWRPSSATASGPSASAAWRPPMRGSGSRRPGAGPGARARAGRFSRRSP